MDPTPAPTLASPCLPTVSVLLLHLGRSPAAALQTAATTIIVGVFPGFCVCVVTVRPWVMGGRHAFRPPTPHAL